MIILKLNRVMSSMASGNDLSGFVENGKKILLASSNFMDIVRLGLVPEPNVPLIILKPTSSYVKEGKHIVLPHAYFYQNVTHQVELGVIIGKRCKRVKDEEAMSCVGGYCLAMDLTLQSLLENERAKGNPWTLSKGFDTATPVSKFIPVESVPDPHNLNLWLKVNGDMRQNGNTKDLIYTVPKLISYISHFMTLEPNDLILTGSPYGSSLLFAADDVECGIGDLVRMKFTVLKE